MVIQTQTFKDKFLIEARNEQEANEVDMTKYRYDGIRDNVYVFVRRKEK